MPPRGFCALPFTDILVSYTGKLNLCSFDAHGKVIIGDIRTQTLVESWNSAVLNRYRRDLLQGVRANLELCEKCDFDGFRDPYDQTNKVLTRGALADE